MGRVIDRPRGQRWGSGLRYEVLIAELGQRQGALFYTWDEGIGQWIASLCDRAGDQLVRAFWRRTRYGRELTKIDWEAPTPSGETAA